tara:strand:- start:1891 stop:2796 length:906 start_codon:yes stop_codon:yes gene_type:complete
MSTFFDLIQPISNLPVFIFLNLLICSIAIHWYWAKVTENFNEKLHRNLQRLALLISVLIVGILFVKQWNIGDLLAFYSIFSFIILLISATNNHLEIFKESRSWFINIFLVFAIRGYIYEPWQIPSESMRPNLEVGDFVLVNRNAYGLEVPFTGRNKILSKGPEYGEIVVFFPPHKPTVPFVKRVIAKGGDQVTYANKKFYVNGVVLEQQDMLDNLVGEKLIREINNSEEYVIRHLNRRGQNGSWIVPDGMYFVSGDNRDNSNDSRAWGVISEDVIWGRADYIWMTWKPNSWPNFKRAGAIQ